MAHDNKSVLFAETWGCRISRYWLEGPKAGTTEIVIPDLPGYPDNINRGSRGTYWVGLAGTRTPSYDLAMTMPAFRRRMARRVAGDEWLFPNVNVGCVVHFDAAGPRARIALGLCGREPSGDHFDARASRLSLSRRRHQQSDWAASSSPTPIRNGPARRPIGESADEPAQESPGHVARARRSFDHDAADGRRLPSQRSPRLGLGGPRDAGARLFWP